MKRTTEIECIVNELNSMGRADKTLFLQNSNLNDREIAIIECRFIKGLSIKESADIIGMETDAFCKAQKKSLKKLHAFYFS